MLPITSNSCCFRRPSPFVNAVQIHFWKVIKPIRIQCDCAVCFLTISAIELQNNVAGRTSISGNEVVYPEVGRSVGMTWHCSSRVWTLTSIATTVFSKVLQGRYEFDEVGEDDESRLCQQRWCEIFDRRMQAHQRATWGRAIAIPILCLSVRLYVTFLSSVKRLEIDLWSLWGANRSILRFQMGPFWPLAPPLSPNLGVAFPQPQNLQGDLLLNEAR